MGGECPINYDINIQRRNTKRKRKIYNPRKLQSVSENQKSHNDTHFPILSQYNNYCACKFFTKQQLCHKSLNMYSVIRAYFVFSPKVCILKGIDDFS